MVNIDAEVYEMTAPNSGRTRHKWVVFVIHVSSLVVNKLSSKVISFINIKQK